jgi:AcrR family transcriptional regulator
MRIRRAARLSREEWIEGALAALARGGSGAVGIEPLARSLRVTKGSFYWHFRDRNDLLASALRRWEESETLNVIGKVEAAGGAAVDRLRRLFSIAIERRSMDLEVALRQWARQDPRALRAVLRVDARRLAYLRALYLEAGLEAPEAEARGLLAYAALLGESFITSPRGAETPQRLRQGATAVLLGGIQFPPYSSIAPPISRRCCRNSKDGSRARRARNSRSRSC